MNKITAYINQSKLSVCAGIIGPMLFVGVFTIEGWLRSGYYPLGMYVSALSLGTRGWIQITNFIVFGFLLLLFALGVTAEFPNGKASKAGPLLMVIIAIGFLFSGPFVMDPMGTLRDQMSIHGTLHGILGGLVFSLMPVSCFVFLRRFREDQKWHLLQSCKLYSNTSLIGLGLFNGMRYRLINEAGHYGLLFHLLNMGQEIRLKNNA